MHEYKVKILECLKNNPDVQHTNISIAEYVGQPFSKIKYHLEFLSNYQMIIKDKRLDGFVFYKLYKNVDLSLTIFEYIKEQGYRSLEECYNKFNVNSNSLLTLLHSYIKSGELSKLSDYRYSPLIYVSNCGLSISQLKEMAKNYKDFKIANTETIDDFTLLKNFHNQPFKIKYKPYI